MENSTINIVMAINEAFIFPTRTTIASIKANKQKEDNLIIYILHFDISKKGTDLLESDSTDSIKIKCIRINENEFPEFNICFEFSKEIMIKLFVQKYLPIELSKVIWLDSDLIVLSSLTDLYNYDISDNYYVAYEDQIIKKEYLESIKFNQQYEYLNVGVMLINLKEIRKNINFEKNIRNSLTNNYKLFKFTEQDLINTLYIDKSIVLGYPHKFNRFVDKVHANEIEKENISILHYQGFHQKPWKGCACRHYMIWWKYARTIKEYRSLYWKIMPTYIKNYIKKIFVKIGLILGIKKKK